MRFVKSHGAANDFVLVEDLDDRVAPTAAFVRALCDRHTGVGADGLIRIAAAGDADFFMDYYNADGAAAEMCGNGIRCLAKYVADRGIAKSDAMRVDTRDGVKELTVLRGGDGRVERVRVDMGAPVLERARIPLAGDGDPLRQPVSVDGREFEAACVSMGNPHCIVLVDDPAREPVERLGPSIEALPLFPARTNVEFVSVVSPSDVRVRVWERGVGETMACGTGACATAVATSLRGLTGRTVAVHLPGGTLEIEWGPDDRVLMTGPADEVFEGVLAESIVALLSEKGWA